MTGWTVDYLLRMKAVQFFALRKSFFELENKRINTQLLDLSDVQSISLGGVEQYKELKDFYRKRMMTAEELARINKVNPYLFDVDDPVQAQQAANVLQSVFAQKARVMGLN